MQFHDGAELTSDDVKATFDRIRKPPQGVSIPRSVLFKAVEEIEAPDKRTVQFVLSEPRPANFIMSAIASGWNVIVRKKTLEDNNYNLRKVEIYPGTGPFKSVKRVENESWLLEKNPNYWNKGLPYLDEVQFFHAVPFSTELGSAILSGRVDYIRITDPVTARKAGANQGHEDDGVQPERHPGHLGQRQEKAVRRSAGAARVPSRLRPPGPDRGRQGRDADAGRRLHLPVLGFRDAEGDAVQAGRLSGRPGGGDQGSQAAAWRRPATPTA